MKYMVPIIIIILIASTSFAGVSNQAEELKADTEQYDYLDKLAFYYYDKYSTPSFSYYKEQFLKKSYNDSLVLSNEIDTSILTTTNGPMDSPWPVKCHDLRHTGRSPYSTANNPGFEVWKFFTDKWLEDTPIIDDDGIIYFGGGWDLYAINPDGTLKWIYSLGGLSLGSSPAIAEDGTIYVGSWDGGLHAINPNGARKWRFEVNANIASSPVIAEDGSIYFGTMSGGRTIWAVNPDGTEKWHYPTDGWITSDPAIGDDGTIYIGSSDTYFYAMNPDGTLKWRFKTGHYIKGPPSIAEDGTVYFGSYDDYLYAVYPNNGTMKWKHLVDYGTETNPSIASDGTVYVGGDKLYAVNPDGTRKWTFILDSEEFIHMSSPAIAAEGTIYFGTNVGDSNGGRLYAVNPDGTKRWHIWLVNNWIQSSPSIAEDGTIYIGSADTIESGYLHAINRGSVKAEAYGPYYSLINVPLQFTGSAALGYPPYSWHWDFGDTYTSDEQNPTHTYTNAGVYDVTLTVTDDSGNTSEDITYAKIKETNNPPNKPTINGPTSGKPLTIYNYDFISTEPDDDEWVYYYVEWGDGQVEDWFGPYIPGEKATASHYWTTQGDYTIRCKSKDNYGDESEWGTLDVTMPLNQQNCQQQNLQMFIDLLLLQWGENKI